MNDEKQYLQDLSAQLDGYIERVKSMDEGEEAVDKVLALLCALVEEEKQLRAKYEIGVRFNVVRTQLQSVLDAFEKEREEEVNEKAQQALPENEYTADETLVYVYLFNAQGDVLKSWQKLLSPGAMFEHSVNRPIYSVLSSVEAMLREKPNAENHAYIVVAIKKSDILESDSETTLKDQYGHPLLRLRQGALKTEDIKSFVHLHDDFQVSSEGVILERR